MHADLQLLPILITKIGFLCLQLTRTCDWEEAGHYILWCTACQQNRSRSVPQLLQNCSHLKYGAYCKNPIFSDTSSPGTAMILNFRTDRSGQTVQTQIRLLLEEQSDQGLHCLLFHLHHFDKIPFRFSLFSLILGRLHRSFLVSENLRTLRYLKTKQT